MNEHDVISGHATTVLHNFVQPVIGEVAYYGEVSQFGEVHYFIPGGAALCA